MDRELPFQRVALIGLGLIGGSLGRALRAGHPEIELRAFTRSDADASAAADEGIVESASSAQEVIAGAQLVVYATPVEATIDLLGAHAPFWDDNALITDVGSLKSPVMQRASTMGIARRLVGGHPMAGAHERGFAASRGDLFENARVWLARGEAGPGDDAANGIEHLWRSVGARPAWIGAEEHDTLMALASQLPQVASSLLAASIAEAGIGPDELGPGGHDATRLAASPPDLWAPLLELNRERLGPPLRSFREAVDRLQAALERGDRAEVRKVLELGHRWRGADW